MIPGARQLRPAPITWALVMVSAAVVVPAVTSSGGVDPVPIEWWGESDVGEGFHLRIPVTVTNHRDHDVENGAVFAELDITHKLIEAGWVSQARSGDDLLRLFNLDEESIRVVAMTDLEPMTGTSIHGRLGLYTRQFEPGDLRRHEVPSTHFEGSLTNFDAPDFKADTNPMITVLWRVPGSMGPGEERHYMVYFDSTTNAGPAGDVHAPADYRGVDGFNLLERSFWSGPGMELVGFVSPDPSRAGMATVIGVYDDTQVHVYTAQDGAFRLQPSASTHDNPFTINAGEFHDIFISSTYGTPFRLVADRPIMSLVDSEGFVPTTAGGIVAEQGDYFLFSTTHPGAFDQDSLYFFNLNPDINRPAVIEVDRLDDDADDQTVNLNGGGNNFPYTIGLHSQLDPNGSGCSATDTERTAGISPGRGDYRATVVSGGPVSLLYGPAAGVTQVPAVDGSPTGFSFWTATSKTNCGRVAQHNHFYAIAGASTELEVYPPHPNEVPRPRLFPDCSSEPCGPGSAIGPLPDEAFLRQQFPGLDSIADRPALVKTAAPTWIMTGPAPTPPSLESVRLRGPLGGSDAGRVFAGFGSVVEGRSEPAYIYALFDDTRIVADIHYTASQPAEDTILNVLGGRITSLPERAGDPIRSYQLEADRPIVVLPRGDAPGFLAGIPVTLEATVHGADYRGHLVDIRSTTGLNPVSGSTTAGQPVTYTFDVTNLGRNAGATDLQDKVTVEVTGAPDDWTVQFSSGQPTDSFRLHSGETKTVKMTVTPPSDVETDTLTPMHVHAVSKNGIGHSVEVDTFIKSSYGVGIWFNGVDNAGSKFDEQSASRGSPINYTVFVQNLGTVPDTVELAITPLDWDAHLLRDDGSRVTTMALAAKGVKGSVAELTFRVTPPLESSDAFLQSTITATSLGSPAEEDKVFAISKVNAPSDLSLEVVDRTDWVDPNGTARFDFILRNDGEGGTEAVFDVRSDLLPGWTEPKLFLRSLTTGQLIPLPTTDPPRISIGDDQVVPMALTLKAPADALYGDQVASRLQVRASDQDSELESFLTAIVQPVHDIEIIVPDGVLHVRASGVTVPFEMRLNNTGNLNETIRPVAASLPPGWTFSFPAEEVLLPRGITQVLEVGLQAPFGVAEGTYEVSLAIVSEDGAVEEVTLPVEVETFAGYASDGSGSLLAQPGRIVWTDHEIRNDGNTLLEATVEAVSGEPWTLAPSTGPVLIPPGANVTIPIGWQVPASAGDGVSSHSARVVLEPQSLAVNAVHETVQVAVDVGRADLRVVEASTFQGPGGRIVHATVSNEGTRTAYGVVVELRAGNQPLDHVTLAVLPAGVERDLTLLRPDGYDGDNIMVLDPSDVVVESSKTNNVLNIDTFVATDGDVSTPGPGVPALLALLVAVLRLRRQPIRPRWQGNGDAMAASDPSIALAGHGRRSGRDRMDSHCMTGVDPC